jgi:hypothetical protein
MIKTNTKQVKKQKKQGDETYRNVFGTNGHKKSPQVIPAGILFLLIY